MEYWEFLLQKEGDQSWLPLESSQVEILEGRYRVMAHTSQVEHPVTIRISQLLAEQMPPKRRVLKRRGQTNLTGLMVVMPFTWLKAGTWEIHCLDGLAEIAAIEPGAQAPGAAAQKGWHYAVQLQVLPQDADEVEAWFAEDWNAIAVPEDRPETPSSVEAEPSGPERRWLDESALETAFHAIDQALSEAVLVEEERAAQGLVFSTNYQIELAQSALMVKPGQPLMVVGRVKAVAPGAEDTSGTTAAEMASQGVDYPASAVAVPEGAIVALRLIDPQTSAAVVTLQQSLGHQAVPVSFGLPVTLPETLETRLLLGEVVLVVPTGAPPDVVAQVLAVQRFTVTVDLAALFDAIANQAETDEDYDIVFPVDPLGGYDESTSEGSNATPESLPPQAQLLQPPPRSMPTLLLPKSGLGPSLPPRIYEPSPEEIAGRRLDLPQMVKSKSQTGSALSSGEAEAAIAQDAVPQAQAPASAPPEPSPVTKRIGAIRLPSFVKPRKPDHPSPPATSDQPPPPSSPIDQEFRTLNLQERFWARLNSLAIERYQAATQRQEDLAAAGVVSPEDQLNPDPTQEQAPAPTAEEPLPFVEEVVIYEDLEVSPSSDAPPAAESTDPLGDVEVAEDILSPPTPILEVPEGELIAGEKVAVTLRVPYHPNRMYLKVWITDPQTRTLADEPRQITHLTPDGRGCLEGSIQLTVPLGCLEARFEAISVDMVTHQESYKVGVSRAVIPADISTPSLEDLDL